MLAAWQSLGCVADGRCDIPRLVLGGSVAYSAVLRPNHGMGDV